MGARKGSAASRAPKPAAERSAQSRPAAQSKEIGSFRTIDTKATSLLEALDDHVESITLRDIDRFAATLAQDDVRFVGSDGRVIDGKDNVVAAHREWFMNENWTFEPEILWTREEAGAGWALTRVHYTENGNSRDFLLLFLFVDENGGWKLLYDQNTPIP
jgi:ketosteroid isomerase-like protein